MTWQTIETAPRDGSGVIVFEDEVYFATWVNDVPDYHIRGLSAFVNPWSWDDDRGQYGCVIRNPTHWQPLPPPTDWHQKNE